MGKLLKILGVVFLVVIAGFAGLLLWAHKEGESVQGAFFTAVLAGDPAEVKALFDPDVAQQIDTPYLAAWMAAVKLHLGAYKGLSGSGFNTSMSHDGGHERVKSEGVVEFERGNANSQLMLVDDKIVAFHVDAPGKMPANWFTKLEDTSLYEERAGAFLKALLSADVEGSLAPMHAQLRAKFDPKTMAAALAPLKARYGDVQGMRVASAEFKPGASPEVIIRIAVDGSREDGIGIVHFGFVELRGVVIRFNMPEH